MSFIKRLEKFSSENPKKPAVISADTGAGIGYGELYDLSGKVYRYLKDHGIGRESVVMICLPRNIRPFVTLIGVWRSGAAAVMIETDFAEERRKYIYEDSGSRLFIDDDLFSEMMKCDTLPGHEETDMHDLAYFVYTSGTTGKPKGVLQEYGMLEMCIAGNMCEGHLVMEGSDRLALTPPLNFSATILMVVPMLNEGGTLIVFPKDVVRDPQRFTLCMEEYRISIVFMTSSMIRVMKCIPPTLKKVICGGELVRNAYAEDIDLYCLYAQSESCFNLASFKIDRDYDVTPVGKPYVDSACVRILDDEGNEVNAGSSGNICYKGPYFRGYLGLPEMTEKAHIGDFINTGDLGTVTDGGNITILGRSDDMIKIRGNRVEPAEIESVIVKHLGAKWAGVRAFTEGATVYLCAYYTGDLTIDAEEAKETLRPLISSYMIPSYFIHIDNIPLNENGKFMRSALPKPDMAKYRADYAAPADDDEKAVCDAVGKVLDMEKVGAADDIFDLGVDSISLMGIIAQLDWPQLSAPMLLTGRTPQNIARIYRDKVSRQAGSMEEENARALATDQPLTIAQLYMFDYQCFVPKSTAWNLCMLLKLAPSVDIGRVASSLEKVMKTHPVFSTIYCFNDDNDLVQRYMRDADLSVTIEDMTESDFISEAENLVKPYKLLNSPLYRLRLIRTERGGYLYIDMHHSIADGTSIQILIRDLCDAYDGRKLPPDNYYLKVEERSRESLSPLYREAKDYYAGLLDTVAWDCFPEPDHPVDAGKYGNITAMIPIESGSYEKLQNIYGVSKNAFFITVSVLSIAFYNRSEDVRVSWTFNGRETEADANVIGTLIRNLYVGIRLAQTPKIGELYREVQIQIRNGIYYSCYPYPGPEKVNDEGIDANLIYQSDLRDLTRDRSLSYIPVELDRENVAADNLLDIEIHEKADGCMLYIDYMADCYEPSSIKRFRRIFLKTACQLILHIDEPDLSVEDLRKEAAGE
ncbi:MAG: AMP-binding protein [Lachnospiraceae bacterium]|nr:AMP-binding protein [Lachnospiraceae bacterium]